MQKLETKIEESENLSLNDIIIANIKSLIKERGLSQQELAKLSDIPNTTLSSVLTGYSGNPKLQTIVQLSKVLNKSISQLTGETPMNFSESAIPVLSWQNLNAQNGSLEINIDTKTHFVSFAKPEQNKNIFFALPLTQNITEQYNQDGISIIEQTSNYKHNDIIIVSVHKGTPLLKRIKKEGDETYLESLSNKLMWQKMHWEYTKIFGVVREIRIFYHENTKTN